MNTTVNCLQNNERKEIRQLNPVELNTFITFFNDYIDSNSTEEMDENISQLGVVQM